MPGLNMGGLRANRRVVSAANQAATTFNGTIAVASSNAKTVTVAKTLFRSSTPRAGWFVTYTAAVKHLPVTTVSTSGANYVLTLNSPSNFSTVLAYPVTISTH